MSPSTPHLITVGREQVTLLWYPSALSPRPITIVLGHGAGAGQTSPFIVHFAQALAARGAGVATFNFPYMEQRRRVPDPAPVLEASFRAAIEAAEGLAGSPGRPVVIGGKSMGGRIATHVAAGDDELPARLRGVVLLGYPLHPPGRPRQLRTAHLGRVRAPMLFVQGSRDAFGTPDELRPVLALLPQAALFIVDGADHSFTTRRGSGLTQAEVYARVEAEIMRWITEQAE